MSKGFVLLLTVFSQISNVSNIYSAEDSKKYKGKGESIIVNNDLSSAKKKALLEAFKDSIQKAVGVYVKTQSKVENFEMTYNKIIGESEGYITNYTILKEKKNDNIYTVEIEAEVSSDKIESAFSQRLSKYIAKNMFGPSGEIILKIINFSKVPSSYSLRYLCPINDPTIDANNIYVKLPNSGWVKPQISMYGITKSIQIDTKHENIAKSYKTRKTTDGPKGNKYNYEIIFLHNCKFEYINDLVTILDKNIEIDIKFKNPNNGKVEIRKVKFDIITTYISDHNLNDYSKPPYVNIDHAKISNIDKQEYSNLLNYLKKIDYWFSLGESHSELRERMKKSDEDMKDIKSRFETFDEHDRSRRWND